MDITAETIAKIIDISNPEVEILNIGGFDYAAKKGGRLDLVTPPAIPRLIIGTLTSLVDYIKGNPDNLSMAEMFLYVANPTNVYLYPKIQAADRSRDCYLNAVANGSAFEFGRFIEQDKFIIGLRSQFKEDDNSKKLLSIAGNIEELLSVSCVDDGISQDVTVKKSITKKENATVPNIFNLSPFRTFLEVDQPGSDFLFRIEKSPIRLALFEADGGMWKLEAMKGIKEFLVKELPKMIILS